MADEDPRIEQYQRRIAELEALVERLSARVAELEALLGRTSRTSSKPPASDPNSARAEAKSSRAERRAAAREQQKAARRRPGKQPGGEGRHLAQVAEPDRRVAHRPERCRDCGGGLGGAPVVGWEQRQVFDIPPMRVEVTEHLAARVRCGCGCETTAAFPPEASAPACFGPGVRALGLYLTQRHHIPVARAAEMLGDVMGVAVSSGWLASLPAHAEGRLAVFAQRVRALLGASPVIHADETSIRVSARSWWLHVASTTRLTWLVAHERRGREAIEAIGVLPGYGGIIVHDGLAAYDYLAGATHAQCNAHLLRHLAAAMDHDDTKLWARLMHDVLCDGLAAARRAADAGRARVPASTARRLRSRYRHALAVASRTLPAGPPPPRASAAGVWAPHVRDAWNLARRMRDDQADILRFLDDTRIPFTNNNAERPLRPAKLHDKISGTFRSPAALHAFAAIRSYLDTAAKHDKNRYQALVDLFTTGPWLPPDVAGT